MGESKILRVVVASPSDVKPERDALKGIIEDINHDVATDRTASGNITLGR